MKPLTVVLFAAGGLLIYAGIKDKDPRSVIRDSLSNSKSGKTPTSGVQSEGYITPPNPPGSAARV